MRAWFIDLVRDVTYSCRSLQRQRSFAVATLVTLALGLGSTTAVFSVVNSLLLRPLPFAAPDRLVRVSGTSVIAAREAVSDFQIYRQSATSFEAMAGYEVGAGFLRDGDTTERVMVVRTDGDLIALLGVAPAFGHAATVDGGSDVAVISHRFWQRKFGARSDVVGAHLPLDGRAVTVIGVMPDEFQFPYAAASLLPGIAAHTSTDLWIALDRSSQPRNRVSNVIGRLRPGVSIAAAQGELDAIGRDIARSPAPGGPRRIVIDPLLSDVVSPAVSRVLFLLSGFVIVLLALAAANVTNLSVARAAVRAHEMALRAALGAGFGRLARLCLTESLVLAVVGGVAGAVIAWIGTSTLVHAAAAQLPRAYEFDFDWRVFAFLFGTCALTGAAIGVVPAWLSGRARPQSALQQTSPRMSMTRGRRRLSDILVVVEIALAFLLTAASVVLLREVVRLNRAPIGLDTTNVLTAHVGGRRLLDTDAGRFYEVERRAAALPGVRHAGFIQLLPLQNWGWSSNSSDFFTKGGAAREPFFPIELRYVTPGYFDALGIVFEHGRPFTVDDTRGKTPVLIVNRALARREFGDGDPVGQVMNRGTIVGVIGDVRQVQMDEEARPELYFPVAQNWSQLSELGMTLVVRTDGPPKARLDAVRAIVQDVMPGQAIFGVQTMDEVVAASLANVSLFASLLSAFALLAVLLAVSGTYGVMTYLANARRYEFGIRAALGARPAEIGRLILLRGAWISAAGIAAGALLAKAAEPLTQGLPIAIAPLDWPSGSVVALVVTSAAMAACALPAIRAAGTQSIIALKGD
jgi:predicted permease